MIKLSILIPSNRTNLTATSRIAQACSWASPDIEVIVRDNSGSAAKRAMLAQFEGPHCHMITAEPCEAYANWVHTFREAKGEFVFLLGDDDACFDRAIAELPGMIERISGDPSVIGIAGTIAIEGAQGSAIVAYPDIDADDPLARLAGYLSSHGPNVLAFSPLRRSVVKFASDLQHAMPFAFSFSDQVMSLVYLLHGKFTRLKRLLYVYDFINWEGEAGQQADLKFYAAAKLDPAMSKLHWFLCGFEGAALIRNLNGLPNYTMAQRQAMSDLWFATMFNRFKLHRRLDFNSPLSGEAEKLCEKWKTSAGQMSFHNMLADICGFMALSSMENAQKYLDFWISILNRPQASAA